MKNKVMILAAAITLVACGGNQQKKAVSEKVKADAVKGDMHDIGKNLVKMMIEGKGLRVVDLGVDVSPEKFLEAAEENHADIICCSALLTTTMGEIKNILAYLEARNVRGKYKVMIGGAPVSQSYCDAIGADYYTPDAASAADVAYQICRQA